MCKNEIEIEEKEEDKAKNQGTSQVIHPSPPFSQKLQKKKLEKQFQKFLDVFKKLHINISFAATLEQMTNYVKFLKDIFSKKRKLDEFETVFLTKECSAILQNKLPPKLKDPSSFTIPCTIDKQIPVILGRPFLATARALIDVEKGDLTLRVQEQQVIVNIFKALKLPVTSEYYFSMTFKPSIREPPNLELKPLPTHLRVCMDYHKLNKATRKYHFPLPFIDQMLDRLAGTEYYCFLYGYSGYNQIAIAPKDQERATFTCPYGTFAFRKMLFGLCTMTIFTDMVEKCLEVFMDDFSIFGIYGHKISSSGIEVDKAKIETIEKLPPPINVKGIRSFLGHAGFSRRFIKDFSKISKPLCNLLKKDVPFKFDNKCLVAFDELKKRLISAPIIISLDWTFPFDLMSDASDYAVEVVLGQRKDKIFHSIYYVSKTLNEA
ncbi:Reverse transcriptase/retrotransposon-derived protein [Theobroma cacao]|nr:Reverse transcriptase/retrotransposon-derived protein [Theobroma cacao]